MPSPYMLQIKASAGSGKTHTITKLFLDYLASVPVVPHKGACLLQDTHESSWGDIVAITFTNAAAAEMKARVLTELKALALDMKSHERIDAPSARRWVNIILRQYGALNIRTIDSLLHLVVRTAALEKELPPDFENTFRIEDMLEPIYEGLLERARNKDDSIVWLLRNVCTSVASSVNFKGFGTGTRIIQNLLPLVDCALTHGLPPISSSQEMADMLEELENTRRTAAQNILLHMDALDVHYAQRNNGKTCFKKYVREAMEACACGEGSTSAYLAKASFTECVLKGFVSDVTEAMERDYASVRDGGEDIFFLKKAVREAPFIQLAVRIADEVEEFQRKNTIVHGGTMARRAFDILAADLGVPTALCRLGSQMRHILLDEFQDTNREQWRALLPLLVEALSTGGSLTWVGDIKQAIYGWRGGDADLFDEVLEEPELRVMVPAPVKEHLPTNWRSRRVIVETNNALFAPLADPDMAEAIVRPLLTSACPAAVMGATVRKLCQAFYDAAQDVRHEYMSPDTEEGYYTLTHIVAGQKEDLNESIRKELQRLLMEDVAQRRPWGDVAILVRSNENATMVSSWLLDWKVPVITENSLLLDAHPLVRESIALLSFLDAPQDDISFWAVVQGQILAPFLEKAGLSLRCLEEWLVGQGTQGGYVQGERVQVGRAEKRATLSGAFRKAWPQVWDDIFAPFFNTAGLMTPYNCLQEWYRLRHVPSRFPDDSAFIRSLLECVHHADVQGHATLGTFLHFWEQAKGEAKAPMPSNPCAVSIMTIHKSKGLQFPVVIVPWLNFTMKDDAPHVPFRVRGFDIFVKRCKEMGDVFYAARAQSVLEAFNVLYVACTRAVDELHAFNTSTESVKSGNFSVALPHLLASAGFNASFEKGRPIHRPCGATPLEEGAAEALLSRSGDVFLDNISPDHMHGAVHGNLDKSVGGDAYLKLATHTRPMHWLPSLKIYRSPLQELMSTREEQHSLSPRKRGLLLHHCLEIWHSIYGGQRHEDEQRALAVTNAVEYSLRTFTAASLPTAPEVLQELARHCEQCLCWYSALPDVHTWAQYALPEQEILDAKGDLHRVDVLIPPQQGVGWRVIDYKTGQESEGHLVQMNRYMELLSALPVHEGAASVEGMLVYLDLQRCRMMRPGEAPSPLMEAPRWCGAS